MNMKIGIDAHAAEIDGSGNCTYIRNLVRALREIDKQNDYVLYVTKSMHPFYQDFHSYENFSIRQLPMKNPMIRIPLALAWETAKDKLDILHVQYISPPFHEGTLVTTIHDLGFLHVPETFSRFEVIRSKIFIRMTAKRAKKIITGSHYSKNDIVETYGIDPKKIEVIPLGVSGIFNPGIDPADAQKILRKYGIQKPYLLCVGRLNPRKNLISLVKAFDMLKKEKSILHKLVIVGKDDFATKEIIKSIKATDSANDVVFTGYVAEEDLPSLYSETDVFIYPSLFEGVGLPVLEAMSCGVPVIASDSSSLTEILGDSGILVDPLNPEELMRAILHITSDQDLRNSYRAKGTARAENYSWASTAQKTLECYKSLNRC
jgi:glycosyltransferase involved in cell wall biosynthesis